VALTFVEVYTRDIKASSSLTNYIIFYSFYNINFILLLVLFFLVVRNLVKLYFERQRKIPGAKFRTKLIITDSVFSMDGDIAPFDKIVALAQKYGCLVMIDEAHALGVMGKNGKGLAEHLGVEDKIDIQMGTLSKAAGSFGAYCCGSKALIDFLINKARSFIYTTAMPPAVAAAAQRAVEIIRDEPTLRQKLWMNTEYFKKGVDQMGFNTLKSQTPIIPIVVGESSVAVEFSRRLLEEGIFVSAIRPPTVPAGTARLRLTVMATHTREDLEYTLEKLRVIGKDLNFV